MDLKNLSNDGKPSLLTLPRGDLQLSSNTTTKPSSSFLLMQLPPGWQVDDLIDSRFVSKPKQQAALVSERKEMSFLVSNVQSSNCYVLVPPPCNENDNTEDENHGSTEQIGKKAKLTNEDNNNDGKYTQELRTVATRLLKPGGSGATFLELRPKQLKVIELRKTLVNAKAVLDPYNDDWKLSEMTIDSLANDMQHSRKEIRRGLLSMEGTYMYTNHAGHDCVLLLSEETQLNVHQAIISTLSEADECQSYAESGVDVEKCVSLVVDRMSREERFEWDQDVVRYCLSRLAQKESPENEKVVKLDVTKIAQWVARHLFSLQSSPWEESLLLTRWQSQIPGVGKVYEVTTSMLRGIAVNNRNRACAERTKECLWKYLPSDQIMTAITSNQSSPVSVHEQVEQTFDFLFNWKECWSLDELQPYLDAIVDATGTSQSDILLQHLRVTTETVDGYSVKLCKKR